MFPFSTIMSSLLLSRIVVANPTWQEVWGRIDKDVTRLLDRAGLGDPLIWAGIRGDRDSLLRMVDSLGLLAGRDAEATEELADICVALQAAARGVG